MSADVRIAYYGAWSAERSCNAMQPENIPAGVLTHINVAFEFISADHEITDEVGHIVGRVSRLKNIYPGLRVAIAIGGWVFNDPPTDRRFSEMASTMENRQIFIKSLVRYMEKYALDGVDLGKCFAPPPGHITSEGLLTGTKIGNIPSRTIVVECRRITRTSFCFAMKSKKPLRISIQGGSSRLPCRPATGTSRTSTSKPSRKAWIGSMSW